MNRFYRSSQVLLPLALGAALVLTGCQTGTEAASTTETVVTAPVADAAQASTASAVDVLTTLTDTELQELISGSTTLEEVAQQRSEAAAKTAEETAPDVETLPAETEKTTITKTEPTETTTSPAYEQELKALIAQLYEIKARAESGLNSAINDAKAEYKALPANKQTQTRKIAICMGKAGQLRELEATCDREVADVVKQMRTLLTENGQSTALADEAEASYKAQKSAMYSSLVKKLYG